MRMHIPGHSQVRINFRVQCVTVPAQCTKIYFRAYVELALREKIERGRKLKPEYNRGNTGDSGRVEKRGLGRREEKPKREASEVGSCRLEGDREGGCCLDPGVLVGDRDGGVEQYSRLILGRFRLSKYLQNDCLQSLNQ